MLENSSVSWMPCATYSKVQFVVLNDRFWTIVPIFAGAGRCHSIEGDRYVKAMLLTRKKASNSKKGESALRRQAAKSMARELRIGFIF